MFGAGTRASSAGVRVGPFTRCDVTSGRAVSPKIVLARAVAPRRSTDCAGCAQLGETGAGRQRLLRRTGVAPPPGWASVSDAQSQARFFPAVRRSDFECEGHRPWRGEVAGLRTPRTLRARRRLGARATSSACHGACAPRCCARPLRRAKESDMSSHPQNSARSALLEERARVMRAPTLSEARLWSQLAGRRLGVAFRRQVVIGQYIVDFLAPAPRLVVEVDGAYHARRSRVDARRDAR